MGCIELNKCKKCGGTPEFIHGVSKDEERDVTAVECVGCGKSLGYEFSVELATDVWNIKNPKETAHE